MSPFFSLGTLTGGHEQQRTSSIVGHVVVVVLDIDMNDVEEEEEDEDERNRSPI
jgi:hypothetical protein